MILFWWVDPRARANRGGGWNNTAVNARVANRNANAPANRDNTLGVRPCKASDPYRQTPQPLLVRAAAPCP